MFRIRVIINKKIILDYIYIKFLDHLLNYIYLRYTIICLTMYFFIIHMRIFLSSIYTKWR